MFLEVSERKCIDTSEALGREWLEANSLGSYASSTLLNCNTRRYHGLLVVEQEHGRGRLVTLSKYEDSLSAKGKEFHLSCHQYPNRLFPDQAHCLRGFRIDPVPRFIYNIGDVTVSKQILLSSKENRVLVRYETQGADFPMTLRIRPLLAFRDSHALAHKNLAVNVLARRALNGFYVTPYTGLPRLYVQSDSPHEFYPGPNWFFNFEYLVDRSRGYDYQEDLYTPGVLQFELTDGDSVIVAASLSETTSALETIWESEMAVKTERARQAAACSAGCFKNSLEVLTHSGEAFFVRSPTAAAPIITTGYHWLGQSTRDALIALPGLAFYAGRYDKGVAVLEAVAEREKDGFLPKDVLGGGGESVESSLWFFWAVQQLLQTAPNRKEALQKVKSVFWPVMKRVIAALTSGERPDVVVMDDTGLLSIEGVGGGLTWMDAEVDGAPVVPRRGFIVEINALWHNALCFTEELAALFSDDEPRHVGLSARVAHAFKELFWIPAERHLGDFSWGGHLDGSMRPSQIIAASVPYPPIDAFCRAAIVELVGHELLTPLGLRSLSPRERGYAGRCQGGPAAREYARNQGAVWPWLLCHYAEAALRDAVDASSVKAELQAVTASLIEGQYQAGCLGFVGEFFDGDPGQSPAGAVASARNHGELIRLAALVG